MEVKEELCSKIERAGTKFTVTGIQSSYLEGKPAVSETSGNLTMVVKDGEIVCFDSNEQCASICADSPVITLENGHVLPGLTAVSAMIGLSEIIMDDATGDGTVKETVSLEPKDAVYVKYGIHLEGRGFARARLGGVTKIVTAPMSEGLAVGVSVGIKTSGKKTILNGGIFQDDVAIHFSIG